MIRRWTAAAALLVGFLTVGIAAAQPTPPHRFFGTLTIDGVPAVVGTEIRAFVGERECSTGGGVIGVGGRYVVDVLATTHRPGCGRGAGETVTFRVGDRVAQQTPEFRNGGYQRLDLTVGGAAPPPPPPPPPPPQQRFNAASLNLSDPRPCIPPPGQRTCDATRNALWNGEAGAWAQRGVTDPDARFNETVVFRVQAQDPAVIAIIARFLQAPYLQVTYILFRGSAPGQTDEYVEVTNLGGGAQDMTGWSLRSPDRGAVFRFPDGFVMNGGDKCRVYTGPPQADSCGNASFNSTDVWPDEAGRVVLYYDALDLPGADKVYNADPNNQPPPPELQGVMAPS